MHLAIFGRLTATTHHEDLRVFWEHLRTRGIPYLVYGPFADELLASDHDWPAEWLTDRFSAIREARHCDFLFSLGGDGTLLEAIRYAVQDDIPVVGVNAGRLGFLAGGAQSQLVAIVEGLLSRQYRLDERRMIHLETFPAYDFGGHRYGLNDVTIHKASSNEMIVIHTYINGEFLNTFWCDGLIVSTPTGSTAYNLACGGPIIMPGSQTFVITPIAPHSLTVRPFVLPDDAVISFEIESRSGQALLAVDSRSEVVDANIELAIRRSDRMAQLVKVNAPSLFQTLRTRLNWGRDIRN